MEITGCDSVIFTWQTPSCIVAGFMKRLHTRWPPPLIEVDDGCPMPDVAALAGAWEFRLEDLPG